MHVRGTQQSMSANPDQPSSMRAHWASRDISPPSSSSPLCTRCHAPNATPRVLMMSVASLLQDESVLLCRPCHKAMSKQVASDAVAAADHDKEQSGSARRVSSRARRPHIASDDDDAVEAARQKNLAKIMMERDRMDVNDAEWRSTTHLCLFHAFFHPLQPFRSLRILHPHLQCIHDDYSHLTLNNYAQ